jgi:hypothetical protein
MCVLVCVRGEQKRILLRLEPKTIHAHRYRRGARLLARSRVKSRRRRRRAALYTFVVGAAALRAVRLADASWQGRRRAPPLRNRGTGALTEQSASFARWPSDSESVCQAASGSTGAARRASQPAGRAGHLDSSAGTGSRQQTPRQPHLAASGTRSPAGAGQRVPFHGRAYCTSGSSDGGKGRQAKKRCVRRDCFRER